MPADQPFRFTVQCSSPKEITPESWAALARKVEDLGYYSLTVSDHLDEQIAPIAALMAAANATSTLRIGSMLFCNDYRHPVVLAKEAATLDVLSGGRFDLGLGAGWLATDYERAGIPLDPPGVRIDRLEEALAVLKGLFAAEPCHYDGKHYQVNGLDGTPKPTQRPYPPIVIGGGGKRVLSLAAREADVVAVNMNMHKGVIDASVGPNATVAATDQKIAWIREAAGERFPALVLQSRIHLALVGFDRTETANNLAAGFGLTPEEAVGTPHALFGSVEEIVEDLLIRRERFGFSSIGIAVDALDSMAPVVAKLAGS
ncbi:TIGR03621 family F420-dependent LLM class oxidoreductase [Kribbella sandramycini]|uniref:Putative F420-dependent oxidoreductase n=1 Tax=Kribbella sandramycini TaxID=60450 RepID=A0A7Y4NXX1_9ACTN|nr:TIGR03621 family F420-dependent LLM class oxidoreductase [Kribbella sandramycini]MBB6569853.1 putative F420-dependent oxidoreductase [Kribbella sandramycini]NOL40322.1 TIGR03621 family F420-dependent LLM class oxidoreductase [Kribbella sandramycini]